MKEKKYNILYLDDEESNLSIFRRAFKQYYNIFPAKSGMEGFEVLKEQHIHLVISDQRMPKMTGVEFLEKILPDYPDTIRIILTGFSDLEDIIRALNKCGIYRYIVKPWNRDEMKLTIDKALETWQLRYDNLQLLDELKVINNSLEEKIKQRTEELIKTNQALQEAKEKAEEASKIKERFLSTMSHEIRTPLNAIIGVAHLLKNSPLNEEQTENLEILDFSAKNLLVLINDILDLSKIEADKVDLEHTAFDFQLLLTSLHKTMRPRALEKGLQLKETYDQALPKYIVGDQVRLGQILNNLIGNAVKFTEQGEVETIVKVLKQDAERARLHFTVRDTGIGIASEMVDKIFEDFAQASSDTTRKFGGTGLGLAITRKLIKLHDSDISLESRVNEGATFTFELEFPIAESAQSVASYDDAVGNLLTQNLQGIKILVVEDNKFNRAIARKFLTNWQAEVDFAENGKQAVEILEKDRSFHLVLMDIQMPEMDGYQASRAIRQMPQPYYQELPIIALSASTLSGEKEKVQEAGMNDYVMKPFVPEHLFSRIATHANKLNQSMEEAVQARQQAEKQQKAEAGTIKFERFRRMAENDMTFYAELLELTVEDYQQFQKDLADGLQRKDEDFLAEICHKIRPSMITMSLEWLYNDLLELRRLSKQDEPQAAPLYKKVLESLQMTLDSIDEELSALSAD